MRSDAEFLDASARNMGEMWSHAARSSGGRVERWDDAVAADAGAPNPVLNRITLTSELEDPKPFASRAERFFAGKDRPWGVLDPWGSAELATLGFQMLFSLPSMVLDEPARKNGDHPSDLRVVEVDDDQKLLAFKRVLFQSFTLVTWPADLRALFDHRFYERDEVRVWVGYIDGSPAGCSVSAVHANIVGVYLVAVAPEHRNKGIGEAMSWAAVSAGGGAPAALQSSAMGLPVYRRMGFRTIRECSFWIPA